MRKNEEGKRKTMQLLPSSSEAELVKEGMLKRRQVGKSVKWKEQQVVLTTDQIVSFNDNGNLLDCMELVDITYCRAFKPYEVPLFQLTSSFRSPRASLMARSCIYLTLSKHFCCSAQQQRLDGRFCGNQGRKERSEEVRTIHSQK